MLQVTAGYNRGNKKGRRHAAEKSAVACAPNLFSDPPTSLVKPRPPSSDPLAARLAHAEEALRRSEASRRESQEYFEKSFFSNPALMTLADPMDGRLIEVNSTFVLATGYAREEALGRSTVELGLWVDEVQRDRFIRLVQANGSARDFEAQFRSRTGALRHVLLTADLIEVQGRRCMLTVGIDITDRRRRECEQTAVYRIAEAASSATDLPALLVRIHGILQDLMPAKNFFVARLNAERTEVSFPIFIDERTAPPPPRPHARYLSDYVIRTRQPLLLRHDEVADFRDRTGYAPRYGWCQVWLGAPLIVDGEAVGAITVQDYHDAQAYRPEDVPFFTFVAAQVAAALQRYEAGEARRRIEAMRRESEEYFSKSFHASPALMAIASVETGRIIETNEAFLRSSGYRRDEVLGRTSLELGLWAEPAQRDGVMAELRVRGAVHGFEGTFRTKHGEPRHVLLNADTFELAGRPAMLITAIDITDRRRREREQTLLYRISAAALDAPDRAALFARVHAIIGEFLSARSFFIALYDRRTGVVSFPLWNNEHTPSPPAPRPLARGLTDYVLSTGRSLLITEPELDAFSARTGFTPMFGRCAAWIAAPLLSGGETVGAVSLQDYTSPTAYRPEDLRLLEFVAGQIVAALQRVEVDAARRESQEYFSKLFHASPAAMTIRDLTDGRLIDVNDAYVGASGYSRAELMGEAGPPPPLWVDAHQQQAFLGELQAHGCVRHFEARFRRRDGRLLDYHLSADLIEVRGRRCLLTAGLDITDQRRRDAMQRATYRISNAVLAGRELPELFREIHETLAGLVPAKNCYVALLDADGTKLTFPYFVDEFAGAPGELPPARSLGLGFTEYVLELGRPVMIGTEELCARLRPRGDYQPPARSPALRLGAPLRIGGRTLGVIAIHDYRDTAAYAEGDLELLNFVAEQAAAAVQRRTAEEALQRAERQYRGIFENAVEGLYQSTPDGRFLRANPALAQMLGYATPEALMRAVNDIGVQLYADAGRRAEFLALIQHADEVPDFESEIVHPDGSRRWISESVHVIRNAAGEPVLFEGVAIDITARREADRVLRAAKEAADEASRAKTQFLASMSHELRTPLNGILGYTQILRRDAALNDKQRAGVGIIHQSAEHLLALINDVLDLAKIEARKLELHPSEFDLPDFGHNVAEFFAPRAREKNLRLETAFAPDLPRSVVADAQRLRQVLFNLLSNAVKFTAQGGVVFSIERAGPAVRFSVSDSGPGIAPADQARLFEPFAQLGDHRQRMGGTGLGLNVSRSILEQMGSQLQVESSPGWGTRFWFDLVLPEGSGMAVAGRTHTPWRLTGYEGERRRVLVADDHEPNRALLVDLLQPLGFEIVTADDGEQAVQLARAVRPHLALLDLRMPRLDGLSAARRIRAELGADAPCIIGISASAHDQQHAAALEAGCAAFIAKPFRDEELFALLARHLGLTWRHAGAPVPGETATPFPMLPFPPSPEQAERLFALASSGDVLAVRTYAQEIAAADPRLADFAAQINDLAARFKMKAIRSLVSRYKTSAPPA